jgi:predicted transcriptional regulator
MTLQKNKEVEGIVEEVMNNKYEAEERAKKSLKENITHKTQAVFQKLYKSIPEVPIVVECTMEEKVLKIMDVIK